MYVPEHFRVEDRDLLLQVIEAFPLGLLISQEGDQVFADPVPIILAQEGKRLLAHVARANPLWMRLRAVPQALVIFQGYNHYISPRHYPSKRDTGKVVPTWNYVNVQVRGPVHVHEDAQWVHDQVRHLSDRHEQAEARPWSVDDAPEDFMASQLRAIVGLDIEVAAIEGKFKLSQNKKTPDRDGVIAGLSALGSQAQDQQALDMAQMMRSIGKIG